MRKRKEELIMAEVAPFRGLRYNLDKIPNLAEVVIPPYDVISLQEQELFHRINPYNMIHLELGMVQPGDSDERNAHTRAADHFQRWRQERVLIRDEQPSIYYYELDYSVHGLPRQTRYGFICVLRLEDFGAGGVRPHEKTFQKVKDERLGLMRACHANLSPVFALYADPTREVDRSLRAERETEPVAAFSDRQGMEHRLWKVSDLEVLQHVRSLLQDKEIFIADGHHRYETAINYRNIERKRFPNAGPKASFEYIMMYLSNLSQGGLTILPTHRLLRHMDRWDPKPFLDRAREFFDISSYGIGREGEAAWRGALEAGRERKEIVIGFYCRKADAYYLLKTEKEPVSSCLAGKDIPRVLRDLDVVVLDQVILRHLMGLSESFLGSSDNIHFKHDLDETLSQVHGQNYQAAFCINPTRIDQVQEVASAGLIMPHKSTYFYPKVGSGMVVHSLEADEQTIW
jgi:uncharacterized protein (DUF1015 family)